MVETGQIKKHLFGPCPLYEDGFSGPCEDCSQRLECILLAVLRKVELLETKLKSSDRS